MRTRSNNDQDGNTCANFIWPLNLPSEKEGSILHFWKSRNISERALGSNSYNATKICSSPVFLYTREQLGCVSDPMITISLRELMSDMCACGGLRNPDLQSRAPESRGAVNQLSVLKTVLIQ